MGFLVQYIVDKIFEEEKKNALRKRNLSGLR